MTLALIFKIIGTLGYMALEYWMGKTDKTQAGSVLEAIINLFKKT